MVCTAIDCAKCCAPFSVAGFIFLIIIGGLLQRQPLYIHGSVDHVKESKACYEGAAIYAATFVLSIAYWAFDASKKRLMGSGVVVAEQQGISLSTQSKKKGQYGAVSTATR